jgi:hypothetical protein
MSKNLSAAIAATTLVLHRPPGYKRLQYSYLAETGLATLKAHADADQAELIAGVAGRVLKEANRRGVDAPDLWQAAETLARLLVVDFFTEYCGGSLARLTHETPSLLEGVEFAARQQVGTRPGPKGGPRDSAESGPRRKLTTTVSEASYDWLAAQGGPIGEVIDRLVAQAQA